MSTLRLDYHLSSTESTEAAADTDEAALRYRLFSGDLEVHVGPVDLSARWGWVPILDAAAGLAHAAGTLRDQASSRFVFTESDDEIRFRRDGREVEVSASYASGSATVPLVDLAEAVRSFVDRVADDLLSLAPALSRNAAFANIVDGAHRALALVGPEATAATSDYLASLPRLPIARCPFTGVVVRHSFEPRGFTGRWWDYHDSLRPDEDLPETFLLLSGAAQVAIPPPWTPFLVAPGPERPFVVPHILEADGVAAVIREARVGESRAFAITYFVAATDATPRELVNTWGTDHCVVRRNGVMVSEAHPPYEGEWDFDLAPWILDEKLAWIAPDDGDLVLRHDLDDCPFLAVDGRRGITRFEEGEAWWPDDID